MIRPNISGVQIKPNQTFALLGGDIDINGGVINALSGRVELGAVKTGEVGIETTAKGINFNYENSSNFGDIKLQNHTLIDVSGKLPNPYFLLGNTSNLTNPSQLQAGSIQFQARHLELSDVSTVLFQNYGFSPTGSINIRASESLKIIGTSQKTVRSGFISENFGTGTVGNINIVSPQISVLAAGTIASKTFSAASGSPININSEVIQISGIVPALQTKTSTIAAITVGEGKAGDVTVSTKRLNISNSGVLSTSNFIGKGAGGNLTVNADSIELIDANQSVIPASIAASNFGFGNAGNLILNTQTLSLRDGATISTASFGGGNAGNIIINASDSIQMNGLLATDKNTTITSSVNEAPIQVRPQFRLPDIPTGSSGNILINTANLQLADASTINVRNTGTGKAGTIQVNANAVRLNTQSALLATTRLGEGGDIIIKANDIQLNRGSNITTDAKGQGVGGNITLDVDTLFALDNSDITANALDDRGGRVIINAQAIFGTQFRPLLTPNSDITATSAKGVRFSGTVDINAFDTNSSLGLIELPRTIANPKNKIEASCSTSSDNKFAIVGRGGIPQSPQDDFTSVKPLVDTVDLVKNNPAMEANLPANNDTNQPELVEAQGWVISHGQIRLVAPAMDVVSNIISNHCRNEDTSSSYTSLM